MSAKQVGIPFEAEVRSADASSGVAVPIYLAGSDTSTAYTLAANEYLEVTWAELITVAGGDSYVLVGADATIGTNEAVVRGTFAANGGFAGEISPPKVGVKAGTLWVVAPLGVVDVKVQGFIRRRPTSTRPTWKEANRGQ
jgi:hypothetical protein